MKNVSFIIPNYNAENTIGKCIDGIIKQKYKGKIEIIVIDDFSKDDSLKIISKYKKVKLIKNEKNLGLAKSLNKAIKTSKYELICIIWCDCVLVSNNWLNEMIKIYNSNDKIGAVTSKLVIPREYWNKFSFYDKINMFKDYEVGLKNKQKEGRPTLFNKKLLFKLGLYDDKTFRIAGEDTDLKWKILEHDYKIIHSNTNMLHLHGFYKLSLKKQLFNKALPLAEATGVNFSKHGIKSLPNKYWNPISSTILYGSLLIPYVNIIALILILVLIITYILKILQHTKDKHIIISPFFKLFKDILTIIGFWKGFLTRKQEF